MMTIKLEEGRSVINVPQSWSEIKLEDYEKWFNIEPKNRRDEVEMIAKICNIESELLLEYPTQLFDTIADSLQFIFEPHPHQPTHRISIDGETFIIAFSDNLSLAEWIDIELVFEDKDAPKLSGILSILCRPVGEAYDNKKSESRQHLFASLTMDKALPLLAFFFATKQRIRDDFEPLFSNKGTSGRVSATYSGFCRKWSWYKVVADLAEDKILLFNKILEKPVVEIFGFLLYKLDKNKAEEEQDKFQKQFSR